MLAGFLNRLLFWRNKNLPEEKLDISYVDLREIRPGKSGLTGTAPISTVKKLKPSVLGYTASRTISAGSFVPPEYDFAEVLLLSDVESFVHQSIWKKVALMYKEGYDFTSPDPRTLDYISTRLAQTARASGKSTGSLLRDIGASLVQLNNAFIYKKRDRKASGGKVRVSPEGKTLDPIAAYFVIPAETMRVRQDEGGNILGWQQEMPDGRTKEYRKDDIVHFRVRAKEGFVFAKPDLIPVIDDIRALRTAEEGVELLLHKHLFPLFQYIVGTENRPAGTTEAGEDEISVMKTQLGYMPMEGGIVTSERHRIVAIGAEGRALRIEGYLEHFKKRVIAGLGISQIDLGDGSQTNKATSRTLSRQLIDTVKDLQDSLEEQFVQEIISELLLESRFTFDVLHSRHMVKLQFREIDLENRIEREEHAAEMFKTNGLTYSEFRAELGREPVIVPEDPEDQDPKKYPDWFQTHWKLFHEPEQIIRAVDEAWSPAAKAAAAARSLSVTSKQLSESNSEQSKKEKTNNAVSNKDSIISDNVSPRKIFKELEEDILEEFKGLLEGESVDFFVSQCSIVVGVWANEVSSILSALAFSNTLDSFNKETNGKSSEYFDVLGVARSEIENRCYLFVGKLGNEIASGVKRLMATISFPVDRKRYGEVLLSLRALFDSLRYRIGFIFDVEVGKAMFYGKFLGMRVSGVEGVEIVAKDGACEACKEKAITYHVDELFLDNVIPHHPYCSCMMRRVQKQ